MIIHATSANLKQTTSFLEEPRALKISESMCSWVAAAITLLAGVLLIVLEVGCLVAFALPTSTFLTVLVSLAIAASVFLLCMAFYQLVTKFIRFATDDAKFETEKTQLTIELENLRNQLEEAQSHAVDSKSAVDVEKHLLEGKNAQLTITKEKIVDGDLQLQSLVRVSSDSQVIGTLKFEKEKDTWVSKARMETVDRMKGKFFTVKGVFDNLELTEAQKNALDEVLQKHLKRLNHEDISGGILSTQEKIDAV
ncbi:hypothetical protein [Chlamydia vaughanii]|uniref:hypothetical protein n=1 Tax=Chlamydia vaughanii TaxID=3112552 RepID=UPI0032B25AE9